MITEDKVKNIIEVVLRDMAAEGTVATSAPAEAAAAETHVVASSEARDIAAIDLSEHLMVPEPANKDAYLKFKKATPARVGIWRTGARYLTESMLRFRADHAVAQDAVFDNVSEEFIADWGLLEVKTQCRDKDEYLTRPDLGRLIDEENAAKIKEHCVKSPRVQIYISDGLSSTAIETNAKDTYDSIAQGLKGHGIEVGTPFFVRYGRVPAADAVSQILDAEVTVVLIGERPGLATGESMSCYLTYKGYPGIPESNRTVLSNIHKGGTPAVEAGAHLADVIKKILEQKASGLNLQ